MCGALRLAWKKREGRTYAVVNEEQWEYAARAGTTTRWYSGNTEDTLDSAAWFDINSRNKTSGSARSPAMRSACSTCSAT